MMRVTIIMILSINHILYDHLKRFGSVYVCITIVYLLFTNLGQRKDGEISAYSMFNENNEKIAGTFDAKYYEDMLLNKKQLSSFLNIFHKQC